MFFFVLTMKSLWGYVASPRHPHQYRTAKHPLALGAVVCDLPRSAHFPSLFIIFSLWYPTTELRSVVKAEHLPSDGAKRKQLQPKGRAEAFFQAGTSSQHHANRGSSQRSHCVQGPRRSPPYMKATHARVSPQEKADKYFSLIELHA